MATDVPFWRAATGAQQRMYSMVQFLNRNGFHVKTFYLGQSGTEQFDLHDEMLIGSYQLDIEQQSSDQIPSSRWRKMKWYVRAIQHQINVWLGNTRSVLAPDRSPKLEEFRWPWAIDLLVESVEQFKPQTILIQYVKLAYLLEGVQRDDLSTNEDRINRVIDTHDVLHRRFESFQKRGLNHWIEISREEESQCLRKFDLIVAIQPEEARILQEMAPKSNVVVCGHAISDKTNAAPRQLSQRENKLAVGYLGSFNGSNAAAIESLISEMRSSKQVANYRLRIAGGICHWLLKDSGLEIPDSVEMMGAIDKLSTFYSSVDVIVNPVGFGTGLKIKNVEALSFGKPLVTTPHGMIGLPVG
ncbi:MAG: glycosyltransferase, partial [Planctomycetota bacterium]